MSGMAIKFTSLAQIEAHQFVSADDRLYLQGAEDFGAGVPRLREYHVAHLPQVAADAAMAENRSAGSLSLRQTRTGRGKHYRIYQLDTADHILAGHSIVCRSDAEAMDAACRLAEQAAAVEVWEGTRRIGCLSIAAVVRRDRESHPHPGHDRFGWHISGIRRLWHGKVGRRNWLWRLARRRPVWSR
jgi:hypothetical protein